MNKTTVNGGNRKRVGMTPQCEAIYKALKIAPCLHFNQLKYFTPPYLSINQQYEKSIANFLSKSGYVLMHDDCIFDKSLTCIDESVIDAVWAAVDMLKEHDEKDVYTALRTAFRPQFPCTLSIFKDGATRFNIMTIYTKMDFDKVIAENQNFNNSEDKANTRYLIVMRNKDLVQEFAKAKPEFPFQIALLDGAFGQQPDIKYYNIEV